MFDATTIVVFLTATIALNISPGPDVFYVLANSARHGIRGGVYATVGISFGIMVHTIIAAFGIAALIAMEMWAFDMLRILGAGYLIWLGIQAWRGSGTAMSGRAVRQPRLIVWRGFVTCLLNPKVGLFFLAFLPQFASPERGSVATQIVFLGLLFVTSGTLVNAAYAWAGGWVSEKIGRQPIWQRRLDRLAGSILVLLGIRLLLPERT
jgi:threonine/homoserine/homoserine lactone efflux protein